MFQYSSKLNSQTSFIPLFFGINAITLSFHVGQEFAACGGRVKVTFLLHPSSWDITLQPGN